MLKYFENCEVWFSWEGFPSVFWKCIVMSTRNSRALFCPAGRGWDESERCAGSEMRRIREGHRSFKAPMSSYCTSGQEKSVFQASHCQLFSHRKWNTIALTGEVIHNWVKPPVCIVCITDYANWDISGKFNFHGNKRDWKSHLGQ